MLDKRALQILKLALINIERCKLDRSWHYTNVRGPFTRLYLITAGEGYVYHHNRKYLLRPGILHLIPGFTLGSYHCDIYLEQYYLHFYNELDGLSEIFLDRWCEYEVEAISRDYDLFARLLELNPNTALPNYDPEKYDKPRQFLRAHTPDSQQSPADYLESLGIMKQLLARFLRTTEQSNDDEHSQQLYRFRHVINYIHNNLHKKITVEQLAEKMYLNSDYFSRLFEQIIGIRPVEYINQKRLEKAQLLLATTEMSQEYIARQAGFNTIHYFSRQFKKHLSLTPGEYRCQHTAF